MIGIIMDVNDDNCALPLTFFQESIIYLALLYL